MTTGSWPRHTCSGRRSPCHPAVADALLEEHRRAREKRLLRDAHRVHARLLDALSQAFELPGHAVYAAASLGITLCPDDGEDAETLHENADTALHRANAEGGSDWFRAPQM